MWCGITETLLFNCFHKHASLDKYWSKNFSTAYHGNGVKLDQYLDLCAMRSKQSNFQGLLPHGTIFHRYWLQHSLSSQEGIACQEQPNFWAPFQYPIIRRIVRSRKVSKARDRVLKCSYRFEIWQAPRQQCCRGACHISERSDNSKYKSRGFETLRDLTIRRLIGYWNGAQITVKPLIWVAI